MDFVFLVSLVCGATAASLVGLALLLIVTNKIDV